MTPSVLIAVAGATAATVTEALWALSVGRGVGIGRLVVLTTRGARDLMGPELEKQLGAMRRDFPRAVLPSAIEWRVCDMNDIRSSEDNDRLADWTLHEVAALADDGSLTLHASLAGGRKTMGFALGAALQLVGRPQDRLYHVLVAPELERPGFFYPRPGRKEGSEHSPIDLAEVPWVPLRGLLGDAEGTATLTFRQLVARASDALRDDSLDVIVSIGKGRGTANTARIAFGPSRRPMAELAYRSPATREFVFYSWLLYRRHVGLAAVRTAGVDHFSPAAASLLAWSHHIAPDGLFTRHLGQMIGEDWPAAREEARRHPAQSILPDFLQEEWNDMIAPFPSRIADKLRRQFAAAHPGLDPIKYAVRNLGHATFEVRVPQHRIRFNFPIPEGE